MLAAAELVGQRVRDVSQIEVVRVRRGPGIGDPMSMRAGLGNRSLLDLLEPGWRRDLKAGAVASGLEVPDDMLAAAVRALGDHARGGGSPGRAACLWPACLVVTVARVVMARDDSGSGPSPWMAWQRAAGLRATHRAGREWEHAFARALASLGTMPPGIASDAPASEALAAHAAPDVRELREAAGHGEEIRLDPFGGGVLLIRGERDGDEPESLAFPGEVTDPLDPLLTFDEGGDPVGPVLPEEPVWALYPEDRTLASDAPPRLVVTSRLPLTWRGWRLVQLDLRGISWIGLDGGRRHAIRGRTKPVLRTGPPLPGLTAPGGQPVYGAPPSVLLPPGLGRWRIVVRRPETGAVLADVTAPGGAAAPGDKTAPGPAALDGLWSRVPRPLLGKLAITVTADGRAVPGLRRVVTVAEGIVLACHPRTRLTSDAGLEPAEALLTAPPGMTASPPAVPFGQDTEHKQVICVAGAVTQQLTVTPPHLRLRVEPEPGSGTAPGPWHHAGPMTLTADDLWRGGSLRLDLPGIDGQPPVEVTTAGPDVRIVQVLEPTAQGRYPLRRMLDTVRVRGTVHLTITIRDSTAGDRSVTIARVSAAGSGADQWAIESGE